MVGVPRSTTTDNGFYSLEEQGGGINAVITSAWASKDDLSGGGSRVSVSVSSRSEEETPLDRIRVMNEVEVDTREVDDGGGTLSPGQFRRASFHVA